MSRLPSVDDVYQVLSAGRVCGVQKVALLYPYTGLGLQVQALSPLGEGLPKIVDLILKQLPFGSVTIFPARSTSL